MQTAKLIRKFERFSIRKLSICGIICAKYMIFGHRNFITAKSVPNSSEFSFEPKNDEKF